MLHSRLGSHDLSVPVRRRAGAGAVKSFRRTARGLRRGMKNERLNANFPVHYAVRENCVEGSLGTLTAFVNLVKIFTDRSNNRILLGLSSSPPAEHLT